MRTRPLPAAVTEAATPWMSLHGYDLSRMRRVGQSGARTSPWGQPAMRWFLVTLLAGLSFAATGCSSNGSSSVDDVPDRAARLSGTPDERTRDRTLLDEVKRPTTTDNVTRVARGALDVSTRDQILRKEAETATTTGEVIRLAWMATELSTRNQILMDRAKTATTADDVIRLARTATNSSTRDQILLDGAKTATTADGVIRLARMATNVSTRDQILMNEADARRTTEDLGRLAGAATLDSTARWIRQRAPVAQGVPGSSKPQQPATLDRREGHGEAALINMEDLARTNHR